MTGEYDEVKCLLGALTPSERAVLEKIRDCGDIRDAAGLLCVSQCTVQTHLHNIHEKLGVRSTMEAVLLLMKNDVRD